MESHFTPTGLCKFTPLYGTGYGTPICYLLQINDFNILLDCGWDDSFDVQLLQPVISIVSKVDAVLLSHADTQHLGALPYLVGKCGLKAPVYSTYPVYKMGQMFLYDHCHARQEREDFDLFSLDDVYSAFRAMIRVRYHQTVQFKGKGTTVSVTAYAAGHMLGGSVWRINAQEEDIVYAVDYNHTKEYHLNGTSLQSLFSRPRLMITDSAGALYNAPDRSKRDAQFFETILKTLRADGNVLLPVDTAGRVLELILLLDKYWHENKLAYPLVLLSSVAPTMVQFAKSCLDWLNDGLARAFQYNLENPFNLRYMKLCTTRESLGALPHGPKVVLATAPSLDSGFSNTLLFEWASDPRTLILFTSPTQPDTLAAALLDHFKKKQEQQKKKTDRKVEGLDVNGTSPMDVDQAEEQPLKIHMKMSRRVFLEGEELREWLEAREIEKALKEEEEDMDEEGAPPVRSAGTPKEKPLRSSSGVLSRLGRTGSGSGGTMQVDLSEDDGPDVLLDGFTAPEGAVAPMFPDEDEPFIQEWDEYGAMIDEGNFKPTNAPGVLETAEPEEETPVGEERPTKIVTVDAHVRVNAQVLYFDYEGRSDGISVSTFLTQIAPQHLVLLHGTQEASQKLADDVKRELQQLSAVVHMPADGDVVELDLTASFRAMLSDSLLEHIHPHALGAYSLAWVEGLLKQYNESDAPQLEPPANRDQVGSTHGGIFIGDVKLSDVKKALESQNMEAHFGFGGTLVCQGGQVLIKKGEQSGHLILEGALSTNYYRVRDALYGQYNIC